MKCPLLHHKENNPDIFPSECFEDCLKEECAWWLDDISMCSIRDLALELRHAQHRLQDLVSNQIQKAPGG